MAQTQLNTSPVFIGSIVKSVVHLTNETSKPNPGSDNTPLLFEAGQQGSQLEAIRIHYLNWNATEPNNSLFLYTLIPNYPDRYCIGQIDIPNNPNTNQLLPPILVPLPPILYGENKTALRLVAMEKLWVALATASTAGFNIEAIGGDF